MTAETTRLRLRVSPGAGRTALVGRHGDAWKVRVTEAPERGRAKNERLQHDSRRLRLQLQEALSAFGEPETATAPEPSGTVDEGADETDERSWYGLPDTHAA